MENNNNDPNKVTDEEILATSKQLNNGIVAQQPSENVQVSNDIVDNDTNISENVRVSDIRQSVSVDSLDSSDVRAENEPSFFSRFNRLSIIPVFMLMIAWVVFFRTFFGGYTGWSGFVLLPIAVVILILGVVLALLLHKNFDRKTTGIVGRIGYLPLYGMYLSVFLLGFFWWGDNGDGPGGGSVAGKLLGLNSSTSSQYILYSLIAFVVLYLVQILMIVVYRIKFNKEIKIEKANKIKTSPALFLLTFVVPLMLFAVLYVIANGFLKFDLLTFSMYIIVAWQYSIPTIAFLYIIITNMAKYNSIITRLVGLAGYLLPSILLSSLLMRGMVIKSFSTNTSMSDYYDGGIKFEGYGQFVYVFLGWVAIVSIVLMVVSIVLYFIRPRQAGLLGLADKIKLPVLQNFLNYKYVKKVLISIPIVLLLLSYAFGAIYSNSYTSAYSQAKDYKYLTRTYLYAICDAASLVSSSPSDAKEAISNVKKPELGYVFVGFINPDYAEAQKIESESSDKVNSLAQQIQSLIDSKGSDASTALNTINDIKQYASNLSIDFSYKFVDDERSAVELPTVSTQPDLNLPIITSLNSRLSLGRNRTCAIGSDDKIHCWGDNWPYSLASEVTIPGNTEGNVPVSIVSGSYYGFDCTLGSNGQAYCWGSNQYGSLGVGNKKSVSSPRSIDMTAIGNKKIISITTGSNACVIASDGQAYCWGINGHGAVGNGNDLEQTVPVAVSTNGSLRGKTIKMISNGGNNTCAIASDEKIYCWGWNYQEGSGSSEYLPFAIDMSGALDGKTIKSLSVGGSHTCVVASDYMAYCWGNNSYGQLGDGSKINSTVPVAVSTRGALNGKTVKTISAGSGHTCVIASDDKAYCWGENRDGKLGDGSNIDVLIPTAVNTSGVLGGKVMNSVVAGVYHTCATDISNNYYCWGSGTDGQLGNGSTSDSYLPVKVVGLP